jgi:hypothetical protein
MTGPLGGVGAIDPGAPTISAKKHRQRTPWEDGNGDPRASTIIMTNVDGGPPGGC